MDISEEAAAWACLNVERLGLLCTVEVQYPNSFLTLVGAAVACPQQAVHLWFQVVVGDWFDALQGMKGKLSGVLSNPPYIATSKLPGLQVRGLAAGFLCTLSHATSCCS